jgi:hypothetical protein
MSEKGDDRRLTCVFSQSHWDIALSGQTRISLPEIIGIRSQLRPLLDS